MTTKTYTVNEGHSLLMPDGTRADQGDEIELDDESAQRHSMRVTLKPSKSSATKSTTADAGNAPAAGADQALANKAGAAK